ncbi:MAG: hemerythrin domain-containing protein [Thermodesulfobacteriota bacterium]
MQSATADLRAEHQGVLAVLKIMEAMAKRLEAGLGVESGHWEQALDFLKVFVDKCHHGKEEDFLFPALEAAGVPRQGGPIAALLAEHQEGRRLVKAMAGAQGPERAKAIRAYVNLLRDHIAKEDGVLFPLADERLAPARQGELAQAYERLENERIGPGRHEAFHAMIETLTYTYLG